jgi:HTH-type transcriptional regulator/antitoxin HigA
MGKSRTALGHIIGRSRATEILSRQRRLTLGMIRAISEAWHLPIASLARPYEIERQHA